MIRSLTIAGYAPETIENIAKICHDTNRSYCQTLGDESQLPWEDAPEWQRSSARKGVQMHLSKYASAEDSHASWMREKESNGWRYGKVKDEVLKTHPCMVSYQELPVEQQMKDHLFRAVVHSFKKVIEQT